GAPRPFRVPAPHPAAPDALLCAGMVRLHYWPKRGRAEQIRVLLNELDQPYEDVHLDGEKFRELRARRPRVLWFGSIPMLEDGELRLVQGPVILSYLARKHGIAPARLEDAARAD